MPVISIGLDLETWSEADLKTVGTYKYAADPSTDVLCASFVVDGQIQALHVLLPGSMSHSRVGYE